MIGPVEWLHEEEMPRLFQEFRRATSKGTGTLQGWGLGLTLVKGMVDAHNGTIHGANAEGWEHTSFLRFHLRPPPGPCPAHVRSRDWADCDCVSHDTAEAASRA